MLVKDTSRRAMVWHLRSARLSLRLGELARAHEEIDRLMQETKQSGIHSASAFRMAIDALMMLRRFEEAQQFVQVGLLAWPHSTGFAARSARLQLVRGNHQQAIRTARQLLLASPFKERYLLEILSEGYRKLGQYHDALRVYRRLVEITNIRNVQAETFLIGAAEMCLETGYYELGLRYLDRVGRPDYVLKAKLLHGAGQFVDAIDAYDVILSNYGLPSFRADVNGKVVSMPLPTADELVDEEELLDISLRRIAILEYIGMRDCIERLAKWEYDNPADDGRVRMALARALVKFGSANLAVQLVYGDRNNLTYRAAVAGIMLTAAEIEGRDGLAERCAKRLSRSRESLLQAEQDGVFGLLLREGTGSYIRQEDDDNARKYVEIKREIEKESPLARLVNHACRALERASRRDGSKREYEKCLVDCRQVLHQQHAGAATNDNIVS